MTKHVKTFMATALVGVGMYAVVYAVLPKGFVPEEFSGGRLNGAELAANVVRLSNESLERLEAISRYDAEGNKSEALILISQEVVKHREAQGEALKLSSQLERMARSIDEIKPERARVIATEAVSAEVALVSHLLNYNSYLLELFQTLQQKFENPSAETNGTVNELVDKINEETAAINEFNRRFNASLAEFDKFF